MITQPGGNGLSWLHAAQTLILKFYSAGFQVLKHSCYKAVPISTPPPYLPYITETTPPTDGYPSLWTAFAAIEADQYVQLISGTMSVTVPASWIHVSLGFMYPFSPSPPHAASHYPMFFANVKTFLIPNFPLSHNDLAYLDATPFGTKIVSPSATMLGLYLHSPFSCVLPHPCRPSPHAHRCTHSRISTNTKSVPFYGKAIAILSTLEPLFPGSYPVLILLRFISSPLPPFRSSPV